MESRSIFGPGPPINLVILIIALALSLLERITTSLVYTSIYGCDSGRLFLYGGEGTGWGAHRTLIVAAGLLLIFALSHCLVSFFERRSRKLSNFLLQSANIILILLVVRSLAVSWAYYHPFNSLAEIVHANNKQYNYATMMLSDFDESDEWFDDGSWRCIENNEFGCIQYNEELKITARKMLFSQCVSTMVMSKNWEALNGTPLPEDHPNTLIEYAYFDENGDWIRPPYWSTNRTQLISQTLESKGVGTSSINWYDMWYLLSDQYHGHEAKAREETSRPLTLREIELRVANAWGDDRPAWWEDDE